jgi:hypothetical protein
MRPNVLLSCYHQLGFFSLQLRNHDGAVFFSLREDRKPNFRSEDIGTSALFSTLP